MTTQRIAEAFCYVAMCGMLAYALTEALVK